MMFVFIFSFLLIILLYFLNFLLASKTSHILKIFSFESGFLSIGKIQTSFSVHFFVIMVMFLIFDLEIVLLMGFIISDIVSFFIFFFFFLFILGGLYMEWYFGKLLWSF